MMYSNKLVVSLKVNGKFLREHGDEISMPFGMEYSIFIKNMESRKAVVKIEIDGEDVMDGNKIVVSPNCSMELDGFMKGSVAKSKFKFIERIKEIEDHRGIKAEDGLIRTEFWFEKEYAPVITYTPHTPHTFYIHTEPIPWFYNTHQDSDQTFVGYCDTTNVQMSSTVQAGGRGSSCTVPSVSNDVGITAQGSDINQQFQSAWVGNLEVLSHVIVLHLKGYKNKEKVQSYVTTREKVCCDNCGTKSSSKNKFCSCCGTHL